MLHVRTPAQRWHMEAMADQAIKLQLSLVQDEASAHRFLEEWRDDRATDAEARDLLRSLGDLDDLELVPHQNDLVRQMLDMGIRISTLLLARYWAVVKYPPTGPGLALSDSPFRLVRYAENHHPMMGVGIGTADEILMPVDRHTMLILHSTPEVGERVIVADEHDHVGEMNQMIVDTAREEVFCHPDDLEGVSALQFQDPNRPLGQVSAGWPIAPTDGMNSSIKRRRHHRYRRVDDDP